jgi:hypothetical protein
MSGIGGPGGVGGPGRPGGVGGPDGPDGPGGPDGPEGPDRAAGAGGIAAAAAPTADPLSARAADVAAGRLTPQAALDQLIDQTIAPELGAAERAELREMIIDLVANDPHLAALFDGVR